MVLSWDFDYHYTFLPRYFNQFRKERRRQCGTTIRYLTECPGDDVEYEDCKKGIFIPDR